MPVENSNHTSAYIIVPPDQNKPKKMLTNFFGKFSHSDILFRIFFFENFPSVGEGLPLYRKIHFYINKPSPTFFVLGKFGKKKIYMEEEKILA